MAENSKGLADLFHETVRDIYDAEKQILQALPKMIKAARSDALREALESHRKETEQQAKRLESVFGAIGKPVRGKRCAAMRAILSEGTEAIREFGGSAACDIALASSARGVEHYEIARYGTLKRWADDLGLAEASSLLGETLQEEKAAHDTLRQIEQQAGGGTSPGRQATETSDRRSAMAMNRSNDRERDEYGRFVSDDDRDYGRGGSRGSSGSYYGRGGSHMGGYRSRDDDMERDERGRFTGGSNGGYGYRSREDEHYRGGYRSREDDDHGYRGRSSGGQRGGYSRDEDYGRGYSSRSRDDDYRGGGSRGHGGWYGDEDGHSEASRRGWSRSDHGGSGWYGDPEGHAEASRRGWARSDHEGSGWYGDPEGHSEASRRGWEGRSDRGYGRSREDEDYDRGGYRGRQYR